MNVITLYKHKAPRPFFYLVRQQPCRKRIRCKLIMYIQAWSVQSQPQQSSTVCSRQNFSECQIAGLSQFQNQNFSYLARSSNKYSKYHLMKTYNLVNKVYRHNLQLI